MISRDEKYDMTDLKQPTLGSAQALSGDQKLISDDTNDTNNNTGQNPKVEWRSERCAQIRKPIVY